jgi:hypothetical protein
MREQRRHTEAGAKREQGAARQSAIRASLAGEPVESGLPVVRANAFLLVHCSPLRLFDCDRIQR